MAIQTGTPGSGTFNRQPLGSGNAGAYATPPAGRGRGMTTKQAILTVLGGFLGLGLLGVAISPSPAPTVTTHFTHPVRVIGQGISVRTDPQPAARAFTFVSSSDSVDNISRVNGQWSEIRLRDGREGFISNRFLEGVAYVPEASRLVTTTKASRLSARRARKTLRSRLASRTGRPASVAALAPARAFAPTAPASLPNDLDLIATPSSTYSGSSSSSGSSSGRSSSSGYHDILTGPRGGHYYINGNGNKTYVRRR